MSEEKLYAEFYKEFLGEEVELIFRSEIGKTERFECIFGGIRDGLIKMIDIDGEVPPELTAASNIILIKLRKAKEDAKE